MNFDETLAIDPLPAETNDIHNKVRTLRVVI